MSLNRISLVAAIAALAVAGCGKKEAGAEESIATVNGDPITAKEYHDLLERKTTVFVSTPQGPQVVQSYGSLGLQALRDVIDRKLVFQLAKEQKVMPTDADVNAELELRSQETPNYANLMISQAGLTTELLRQDIMFDLARERLLTKGVTVGMPEVEQYIKENPKDFMEPAKANLLIVVVSDPKKKQQVDQDLSTGQNFQNVAARYSEFPQARENGGAYPETELDRMPPKLQDLIAKTPKLKATQWVQDGKNWVKFFVQDKSPAKPVEMTDAKKKKLQRTLAVRRGQMVNDLATQIQDRLKKSEIKVTPPHLNLWWTKLMEQVQKLPATPPPTGGGSPSAGGPAPSGAGAPPPGAGAAPK